MKKIVIMSDNHGATNHIEKVRLKNPDADYYIHCGDFESYDDVVDGFIAVTGNNDWGSALNKYESLEVEGYKILICHGQQFGYFSREQYMVEFAKENHIDILISGHTHMPLNEVIEGIHLINPGSTYLPRGGSLPSYAILTIDQDQVQVEIIPFE